MGKWAAERQEKALRQPGFQDLYDVGRKRRDAERQAALIRQNDILIEEAVETNRLLRILVDRG